MALKKDLALIMRSVRKAQWITIDEIRQQLAVRHGANFACPITTEIFAWIAAHAADEGEQDAKKMNHAVLANTQSGW